MQVEKDATCRKVLEQRMADQCLHKCPVLEDVTKVSYQDLSADGVVAGFPCQALGGQFNSTKSSCSQFHISIFIFERLSCSYIELGCRQGISTAGAQKGLSDARSGLIREVFRARDEIKPSQRRRFRPKFGMAC